MVTTTELTPATRRLAPLVAALALFLMTSPLAAQDRPLGTPAPPSPPDRDCVCAWGGEGPGGLRSVFRVNRARLGVELGSEVEVGGAAGISLRSVQEGGPAARAGLRGGDVLLSLDGTNLGEEPTGRLLELLGDVEPGDTVTVGYSRDGRQQTARVVTDEAPGVSVFRMGDGDGAWSFPRIEGRLRGRALGPDMSIHVRELFGHGLELVEMNEGLGRYFDTTEGVLVASIEDEESLGLQAGDVILSIGGRDVQDPGHARSIIASYRADETISFEVVRERRRLTVTGTREER
jgi:serine protease Do